MCKENGRFLYRLRRPPQPPVIDGDALKSGNLMQKEPRRALVEENATSGADGRGHAAVVRASSSSVASSSTATACSPWELQDLRKTCAMNYDEHVPESSVEILGHSVGGITYRHYAQRAPLAFRAIMTLPQPNAFSAILRGGDSECPCCRRRFADAD
jgi:hypothetical protein